MLTLNFVVVRAVLPTLTAARHSSLHNMLGERRTATNLSMIATAVCAPPLASATGSVRSP